MGGSCRDFPDVLRAVGVRIRVEVPRGVTTELLCGAGVLLAAPPQPSAEKIIDDNSASGANA